MIAENLKSVVSADELFRAFDSARGLQMSGDTSGAEAGYRNILNIDPDHIDALLMLGVLYGQTGKLEQGFACTARVLELAPDSAAAHSNHGNFLKLLQREEDAVSSYKRALAINPDYPEAINNLGQALFQLGHYEEATTYWNKALTIRPNFAEAHSGLAAALIELRCWTEAIAHCETALAIRPDYAEAHSNAAVALIGVNRNQEAIAHCERALEINPDNADAHANAAVALTKLDRYEDALVRYERASRIKPDDAKLQYEESFVHLTLGDFAKGFTKHESRWQFKKMRAKLPASAQPRLKSLVVAKDKTVLLCSEQGLGDTLQFVRYTRLFSKKAAKVLLAVQRPLIPLLANMAGVECVRAMDEPLPAFDYYCSLMSLPHLLGTTLETIPSEMPYLRHDPQKKLEWQSHLGQRAKLLVGVSWSGNAQHTNDRNRSIPLERLAPLFNLPDITFISLQQEVRPTDAATLERTKSLRHYGAQLKDFSDTAALIACMDLVISVDTSVAHLAGGMGKPFWLILPYSADWRWLRNCVDSPWYPTAKLFRQTAVDDWSSVIQRVVVEIQRYQRG